MDRLQQQQSAEVPLPPGCPAGSLGSPLARPSGGSRGFTRSVNEQWQLGGVTEVRRREDSASAVLPHHGQTLTGQDYGKCSVATSQPAAWSQPLKAATYNSPHRVSVELCTSGSSWGSSCGSPGTLSSSASQFSAASPARGVEVVFLQQRIPIPSWACCGGRRETVGSYTASMSSGSSVRSPPALNHLSHDSDAAPAGVVSYGVSEEGLSPLSATIRGSSSVAQADSHLRGRSAVPYRQTQIGTFQRRETSPPTPVVQAPVVQPVASGFFGPRGSTPYTVVPIGLPVTRHFDPLRASPFELSKFDRCCDGICPLAHTKLEKIFHPIVYKTQKCQMALADTGRCPYINKCAFFHTEEDRKIGLAAWQAWEDEWASWPLQIYQLLHRHHKMGRELQRKVDGIIKIRIPRFLSSDLWGKCLANLGVLTRFGEKKKSPIQQSSKGVGTVETGVGTASLSTPRRRSSAESGFAGETMGGLADSGRAPSGPHLAERVASCGLTEPPVFGLQAPSAVIGNTWRLVEHREDHAYPSGRERLYVANHWDREVAQQFKSGGSLQSQVETPRMSTRSTLQQPVTSVGRDGRTFPSCGTAVSYPGRGSKYEAKSSLPSEHGSIHGVFAQRAPDSRSLHGSSHKLYGCSTLGYSPREHESFLLRASEASVRTATAAEVEMGKGVVSSIFLSESQQPVSISSPVDATMASRMSTREARTHEEASCYPKPLNVFVCKPLHFARPLQANAVSGKPTIVGAQPLLQPAMERECADPLQAAGVCRVPGHPTLLATLAPSSWSEIRSCEDDRGAVVSGGGSPCRSSVTCFPRTSSDSFCSRPYHQQAVSTGGLEDRQKVVWTRATTEAPSPKERGQVGEIHVGSEGAVPSHQQSSTWKNNTGVVGLKRAQTGQVTSQSRAFESQEPLRVADDDASVLHAAAAVSQALPFQRSISLVDASPLCLLKNNCESQLKPLSTVASQGSLMPPASCTPVFRPCAGGERPGFDSTDGSKNSALSAQFGWDAQTEMGCKYNAPSLLSLPSHNVANPEGEAVGGPQKPVAANASQDTLEEPAFGQFWSPAAPAEGAVVRTPLPDVSEGEAFSVAIDTVMSQNKVPFREGCVTVSKDELNLLARRLNNLLRTAAEEIQRLDIGAVGDLSSTDYHLQNRNQVGVGAAPTTSGRMDNSALSESRSNQEAEVSPSSKISSPAAEAQGCAATVPKSERLDHSPD